MNKTRVIIFCSVILMFSAMAWASPVPDTGQTKCYDVAGKVITCPSPGQALYGQDANYSINPMSYTKLDGSGNALPDSATSWVMVKDNVTGLIWEMKTNKDGVKNYNDPHDADNTYTWYDSNPATNGGNAGTPGSGTDTEDFIKALNDANYGGYSDWRLPTIKELAYIVDYSIPYPGPTINTTYFPNTAASWYWSSTTDAAVPAARGSCISTTASTTTTIRTTITTFAPSGVDSLDHLVIRSLDYLTLWAANMLLVAIQITEMAR